MGLFEKLLEKKNCDICGSKIGLLGNRKLEDGNCCKECAKKLSPWFSERKHSTVAEIKEQLDYRENNRAAVASFQVTRSFGTDIKVLVDEGAGKFMVTRARDLNEANPDVLEFCQVTAYEMEVKEAKNEVYREVTDSDGEKKRESYSPQRYKFSYDFQVTIRVNHPYFDEMNFSLSNGYFEVKASGMVQGSLFGIGFTANSGTLNESSPTPPSLEDRRNNTRYAECERMSEELREILMRRNSGGGASGFAPLIEAYLRTGEAAKNGDWSKNPTGMQAAFAAWTAAGNALMDAARKDPEGAMASGAMDAIRHFDSGENSSAATQSRQPKRETVTCPWCGTATANGSFCENCGGSLKG